MTDSNLKKDRAPGKGKVTRPKGRRWTHELDVVGLKFRCKRDVRRAIFDMINKRGSITGMRLVREPDNPADSAALMVCMPERIMGGAHIGYIRAPSAELLSPRIDKGTLVVASAKLESLDADEDWNSGTLVVTFIDVDKPKKGRTASKS